MRNLQKMKQANLRKVSKWVYEYDDVKTVRVTKKQLEDDRAQSIEQINAELARVTQQIEELQEMKTALEEWLIMVEQESAEILGKMK